MYLASALRLPVCRVATGLGRYASKRRYGASIGRAVQALPVRYWAVLFPVSRVHAVPPWHRQIGWGLLCKTSSAKATRQTTAAWSCKASPTPTSTAGRSPAWGTDLPGAAQASSRRAPTRIRHRRDPARRDVTRPSPAGKTRPRCPPARRIHPSPSRG